MPSRYLFWDVDTQVDFIDPAGKLYVSGAEGIVRNLERLTRWAATHGILVVASACAHHPGDPEFAQYPPHCLAGTSGQHKIPETSIPGALTLPNRKVDLPQDIRRYQQIILEKQQLDVFSNPNTVALLERLGPVREIILYGVVTEICVALTAQGLLQREYPLTLITDAFRAIDPEKAKAFLGSIERSGAKLTTTSQLLATLARRPAA